MYSLTTELEKEAVAIPFTGPDWRDEEALNTIKTLISDGVIRYERVSVQLSNSLFKQDTKVDDAENESPFHSKLKLACAKYLEQTGFAVNKRVDTNGKIRYDCFERPAIYGRADVRHNGIHMECGRFDSLRGARAFGYDYASKYIPSVSKDAGISRVHNNSVDELYILPYDEQAGDGTELTMYRFQLQEEPPGHSEFDSLV